MTDQTARALWIEASGTCAIKPQDVAAPRENEVQVRTLYSGISRGTEALVFHAKVPAAEFERMRAPHMEGSFPFPVKYGYCAVGKVEAGHEQLVGKTVFCLYPHQDRFTVTADAVLPLPDGLPASRAVLCANMETALNIVWDAQIQPGDRVAIFGGGVVGSLVAYITSQIPGTDTVLIDVNAGRASHAQSLGIPFVQAGTLNGEFDVLINASASQDALREAIASAGLEARIVEASWYGDRSVELPLGGSFHSKRLSLVSSQVGTLPAAQRGRWSFSRRMEKALQLLCDDRLDILISGETEFSSLADDYADILSAPETLCHRIRY